MAKNVSKAGQSSSQAAPKDGWQAELDHNFYEDDRKKMEPSKSKTQSSKSKSNHEKDTRVSESSEERRERRLREKREREAVETERKERERDFARKRHASVSRYKPRKPPAGYRDPNEACRPSMPGQLRDERRRQMKALMNCIAYEGAGEGATSATGTTTAGPARQPPARLPEMDHSLSSDTTSDMTDVTPRSGSSSSGCSSMSKQSTTPERSNPPKRTQTRRSKSEGRSYPRRAGDKKNLVSPEAEDADAGKHAREPYDAEIEEMRYLQEAFEDFDLDEESSDFATSIISGLSEERRAKCGRKNMTFTSEQLREIERVNRILLKKIMAHRKPRGNTSTCAQTSVPTRKTSAAINRAKADKNIEKDNMVLLRRLQSVKATTGSMGRKSVTPTPAPSPVC